MTRLVCIELAESAGVDPDDLLEYWGERAAIRELDGGQSREEAEQGALEDIHELMSAGHWMLRKGPKRAESAAATEVRDQRRR